MTYDELKKIQQSLYPVNDVKTGYAYWVRTLTEKTYGMFEYSGLPEFLPSEQIEQRLILGGWCGVFKHSKYGLVTSWGSLSDIDLYYMPLKFTYTQPILGSNTLDINKNAVIIYNSHIDSYERAGLLPLIKRYARMLADIDSSINILTVNTRASYLTVAKNQTVAKTVDEIMSKLQMGEYKTINEQTILDAFHTFPFATTGKNSISELVKVRRDLLGGFLEEIGIKIAFEKNERLIRDEVSSNNQLLIVNQADMLLSRERGIEKINKIFGTEISVKINDKYNPENTIIMEGGFNDINAMVDNE